MIFWWFSWYLRGFWRLLDTPFGGSWADGLGRCLKSRGLASVLVAFWGFLVKTSQKPSKYHQNIIIFITFERFWALPDLSRLCQGSRSQGSARADFKGCPKYLQDLLFELWDPDLRIQILRFSSWSSKYLLFGEVFERFWAVLSSPSLLWLGGRCPSPGLLLWSGGLLEPFGWSWPEPLKNLSKYHHFHSSDLQNPSKTYQKSSKHHGRWSTGHRNIMVFACFWPLFGPPFWQPFPGAFRCRE